jgi:LysR family transcriptional activator of nhaA
VGDAGAQLNVLDEIVAALGKHIDAIALLQTVVVQDELRTGVLVEHCVIPQLFEDFYAITVKRHFQSPKLRTLLKRRDEAVLPEVSEQA